MGDDRYVGDSLPCVWCVAHGKRLIFAVCCALPWAFSNGTRQIPCLPCAFVLPGVDFAALGKCLFCRVPEIRRTAKSWHTAFAQFPVVIAHSESNHDVIISRLDDRIMAFSISRWYLSIHSIPLHICCQGFFVCVNTEFEKKQRPVLSLGKQRGM